MQATGAFHNTVWQPLDELTLTLDGLNLDTVYESLARQIAGGRLGTDGDVAEATKRDNQRKKLERDIAALEKEVLREKQFDQKVELNAQLKNKKSWRASDEIFPTHGRSTTKTHPG